MTYLAHSLSCLLIGDYIGTRLWPALAAAQPGDESKERPVVIHSWERHIGSARATGPIRNARGWLSFVPGVFVFGVPSLAALAINYELAWAPLVTDTAASGLRWAWFAGSVTVVAGAGLFGWAQRYERREPEPTAERQDAGDVEAVLHIEAQIDGRPPTHGTAVLTPAAGRDDAYPS